MAAKGPQTIHLAHSPDADDAFMFWALAAGRIDTGERRYVVDVDPRTATVTLGDRADLLRDSVDLSDRTSTGCFHTSLEAKHVPQGRRWAPQ